MNAHDETEIDNLPFEEYSQVMAERGAAEFGDPNKPKLSFKEIVASDMTFPQIEAEYGEETAINSGIARDPDTWDVDGRRLRPRPPRLRLLSPRNGGLGPKWRNRQTRRSQELVGETLSRVGGGVGHHFRAYNAIFQKAI